MSDGFRNEKARQVHRQLKKELCGCISVPSNAVASETRSIYPPKQEFNEDNYFGWAVYERGPGDREYQQLKHQESEGQVNTFPGYKTTNVTTQRVDKNPVGPQNELARQRHRDWRKEEYCCESVSNTVDGVSSERITRQELSEDNHFGWTVYGKAYGDPEFEKLMQFYEKPDNTGNAFQKKTYVLYLKEGTVSGRDAHTTTEDSKITLPIGDLVRKLPDTQFGKKEIYLVQRDEENKDKKTNLISEYFFLPIKERSRSRSPKSGMSKQKLLGQLTDHAIVPISEIVVERDSKVSAANKEAGDVSASQSQEQVTKTNMIGTKSKKRKSLSRYLRAGSDIGEILTMKEKPNILKKVSDFIINLKQTHGSKSRKDWEYLLITPSGTNEYLYLSSKNTRN